MILLDNENLAILNILRKKSVPPDSSGKYDSVDANVPDDDGIKYHIHSNPDDKSKIFVDVAVPFYNDLKEAQTENHLSNIYKSGWSSPPAGFNYRIIHDLTKDDKEKDQSCVLISLFRRNLYGAILTYFYSKMASGCNRISLTIRRGEIITFDCKSDRVTITYTIAMKDQNDIITSRVFFLEFKEGKKAGKNAPQVLITFKDPPAELAGANLPSGPEVGHLTFILTPAHGNAQNMPKTIDCIHNFLPYFKYHLSCSKAYLHSRMRSKTEEFIKVLNRARPESTQRPTEKRSAQAKNVIKT